MNRQEIKSLAKTKIKGNIWNIIWPLLVIGVVEGAITGLFGGGIKIDVNNLENINIPTSYYYCAFIVSILSAIVNVAYIKYLINFVRTGKFEPKDILNTLKAKWLNILIAIILVSIIVGLCSILFVIPGIIMGIAYTFVTYLVVDTDVSGSDSLKVGREMMKGYKWDYFVFILSFIGWYLLVPLTFGILLIWLVPYFNVSEIIYYNKLKELKKID